MRKIVFAMLAVFAATLVQAQDITGSWVGVIHAASSIHLIFNIKKTDTGYSATFDCPEQKAVGIACGKTSLTGDSIKIGMPIIRGGYSGVWDHRDSISGIFRQGAGKIELGLKRISEAEKANLSKDPVRPQTPKKPYGYYSEDVEYDNADKSLHYGATFTRPDGAGQYPTAIIISGSGTQDRNGTMMGHQPYWVLADYLTKHGIAVLRVDDRGAGKSSLGPDINNKTSLDFSYDVETSLNYLEIRPDVDKKHIGLIGHSEGGIIAPMVAARRKDVNFIVMWGASEVGGAKILVEQYGNELSLQGVDSTSVAAFSRFYSQALESFGSSPDEKALNEKVTSLFATWKASQTPETLKALNIRESTLNGFLRLLDKEYDSGWLRFFIAYDPAKDLSKVRCSVLAVNGEKDTQVIAAENLAEIKEVLTRSGNKHFEVKALPGLNHLLQTAKTGQADEYEQIQETMSPMAMNIISTWIKLHTR